MMPKESSSNSSSSLNNIITTAERSEIDRTPLPEFLLSLGGGFPEDLILVRAANKNYMAYNVQSLGETVKGIICFTTYAKAEHMMKEHAPKTKFTMEEHTFDEARTIAKKKNPPITCLILLDNKETPIIHYVS
jgi:hypothetical protein